MKLKKILKLHRGGCAESCVSIQRLPYDHENHEYEMTYFEEEDQEMIMRSNIYKQIKDMQVDHFHVIGGGIYPVELCIYLRPIKDGE